MYRYLFVWILQLIVTSVAIADVMDDVSLHNRNEVLCVKRSVVDDRPELQATISIKYDIYGKWAYIAYTQDIKFDVFNTKESSPFRTTDHSVELFYRSPVYKGFSFDAGVMHQSNGESDPYSRSWNVVQAIPKYVYSFGEDDYFELKCKVLERIKDIDSDDNPDIVDKLGHVTIEPRLKIAKFVLRGMYQPSEHNHSFDIAYPVYKSVHIVGYYFKGYGESLIDYNNDITSYSIGITINPNY